MDLREINIAWTWLGHITMCILAIWALRRGSFIERTSTAVVGSGWIVTPLVQSKGTIGLDIGTTSVDLIVFVLLTWLSCKYRQIWLLFASASMLWAVVGHFSAVFTDDLSLQAYVSNNGFWSGYMLLLALFIGMLNAERGRVSANSQG